MRKLARTVSIKSTIPDYTAKEEYGAVVDAQFVRVPCTETLELRKEAINCAHCTILDPNTVDEVARGLVYASLAFTDEKQNTLSNTYKKKPWHTETLKAITGSPEKAQRPLSQILSEDMNLEIDEGIDVSGTARTGQVVDVHGYIAHNDETIVLAYHCSKSAFDWLADVPTARCPWDIDKDFRNSGWFNGVECLLGCSSDGFKPCVYSKFYHSFLASLPMIKRNIEPLLAPDKQPRKLFVTGHGLGAGVATLAACYFMLEFDWAMLPHSLVMVTAGSPRSCCRSMKEMIDERRLKMGSSVRLHRVVKGQDIVAAFPSSTSGFAHIVPKILIDDGGTIFKEEEALFDEEQEAASVIEDKTRTTFLKRTSPISFTGANKYDRFLAKMPKGIRDHLPDAYIMSLFQARGIRCGAQLEHPEDIIVKEDVPRSDPVVCDMIKEDRPDANEVLCYNITKDGPHPDPVFCPSLGPSRGLSQASSSKLFLEKNKNPLRRSRCGPQREQPEGNILEEDVPHPDPVLCPSYGPNIRLSEANSYILLEKNKRNSLARRFFRWVGPI